MVVRVPLIFRDSNRPATASLPAKGSKSTLPLFWKGLFSAMIIVAIWQRKDVEGEGKQTESSFQQTLAMFASQLL